MEEQNRMFYGGSIFLLKKQCAYNSLVHNHNVYQKSDWNMIYLGEVHFDYTAGYRHHLDTQ